MLEKIKQLFKTKPQLETSTEDKIEELFEQTFSTDTIRLEIGSDIVEFSEIICSEINNFRENIAEQLGFIFPAVHIIQKNSLQENEMQLFIREQKISNYFMIPNNESIVKETKEILNFIYKNHLDDIFTNDFFEKIITKVQINNGWLIWNVSCLYTATELRKVFIEILKQKKSIKNAQYIFEKIGDVYPSVSAETLSKIITNELF